MKLYALKCGVISFYVTYMKITLHFAFFSESFVIATAKVSEFSFEIRRRQDGAKRIFRAICSIALCMTL